jgi:hypothetical protein
MEEVHCMASIGDKLDLNDLVNFEEKGKYNNSEFDYAYYWPYLIKVSSFRYIGRASSK